MRKKKKNAITGLHATCKSFQITNRSILSCHTFIQENNATQCQETSINDQEQGLMSAKAQQLHNTHHTCWLMSI